MTDELRDALARSAQRVVPSPAPVTAILRAGRGRRARGRGLAAAACLAVAAVALPLTGAISRGMSPASGVRPAEMSSAASAPGPGSHTFVIGKGRASGRTWWVLAVYYPSAPDGCSGLPGLTSPPDPSHRAAASLPPRTADSTTPKAAHAAPPKFYAVITGASTNGRTISHVFGCDADPIGWNPGSGNGGDNAVSDAPGAPRAFIGHAGGIVAAATMTLRDGTEMKASVVGLPGSGSSFYAFVVPDGLEKSLDEYDAHHHLVSHQSY